MCIELNMSKEEIKAFLDKVVEWADYAFVMPNNEVDYNIGELIDGVVKGADNISMSIHQSGGWTIDVIKNKNFICCISAAYENNESGIDKVIILSFTPILN
jgi:hypothetical protein